MGVRGGSNRGCTKLHIEGLHDLYSQKIVQDDQMKEGEMCRACGTHGRDKICIQDFGCKMLRKGTACKIWTQMEG